MVVATLVTAWTLFWPAPFLPPCGLCGIVAEGGRYLIVSISFLSPSQGRSLGQANRQRERSGTPVGNPADLAEFLGNMGLGKYAQALTENEIDLEAVQLMAESDFQDIGRREGRRLVGSLRCVCVCVCMCVCVCFFVFFWSR